MATRRETDRPVSREGRATLRAMSDVALVVAMRNGEEAAFREFILRFEVQLEQHARRLGLSADERRVLVADTIDDAAIYLIAPGRAAPRSLRGYLVTALRNRHRNDNRTSARSRVREERVPPAGADGTDGTLGSSEEALRTSGGPGWSPPHLSPAVAALAAALTRGLDDDELLLLGWVSHHIPYREIATWLDVGYATVGKRVERLRARLRARAVEHLAGVPPTERVQLDALLARGAAPDRLEPPPLAAARAAVRPIHREGASR